MQENAGARKSGTVPPKYQRAGETKRTGAVRHGSALRIERRSRVRDLCGEVCGSELLLQQCHSHGITAVLDLSATGPKEKTLRMKSRIAASREGPGTTASLRSTRKPSGQQMRGWKFNGKRMEEIAANGRMCRPRRRGSLEPERRGFSRTRRRYRFAIIRYASRQRAIDALSGQSRPATARLPHRPRSGHRHSARSERLN